MSWKTIVAAALVAGWATRLFAQPILHVVPGGLDGGNFVWNIGISPDFVLAPGGTPLAVEMGFRLTGAPLLSATNVNPGEWDTPNPGLIIFGWETLTDTDPGPGVNLHPVGLQSNTATDEVFVAYGSIDFTTPGLKPFLQIVTQGPANGGPSLASTIEWLGVYAVGHGRISQLINGPPAARNFDIYAGTAT